MIKYYCDICGDEITSKNEMPTVLVSIKKAKGHKTGVKTLECHTSLISVDGVEEGDLFCKYCVISSVSSLDDRDKAVCEHWGA